MLLFLRDIPADTTPEDVKNFIARAIDARWYLPLRETGHVREARVLHMQDPKSTRVRHHALAEVLPDRVGALAILKLNGGKLAGTLVEVRRWYRRSPDGERRRAGRPHALRPERRRRDRRRQIRIDQQRS